MSPLILSAVRDVCVGEYVTRDWLGDDITTEDSPKSLRGWLGVLQDQGKMKKLYAVTSTCRKHTQDFM
jgi:hypothetical protein